MTLLSLIINYLIIDDNRKWMIIIKITESGTLFPHTSPRFIHYLTDIGVDGRMKTKEESMAYLKRLN